MRYHVMERDEEGRERIVACRSAVGAAWEKTRLQGLNPARLYWTQPAHVCACAA